MKVLFTEAEAAEAGLAREDIERMIEEYRVRYKKRGHKPRRVEKLAARRVAELVHSRRLKNKK